METTYLSKDNNWANGSTTYWFDVNYTDADGEEINAEMGVAESGNDKPVILDCESCPIHAGTTADYHHYADLIDCVTDEMRLS